MEKPWEIRWFDTLGSTNDALKNAAAAGAPEGAAVAARTQTGGKGRLGRVFQSPAGTGMYLSVLLRPQAPVEDCIHLTCTVAVAVHRAIEKCCGLACGIKWPNDLTWGNRKLGGILTEVSAKDGKVDWAVVGIGINCRAPQGGFPPEIAHIATDLESAGGACTPEALADAVLQEMEILAQTCIPDRKSWMDDYRKHCVTTGKTVEVITPLGSKTAVAKTVADDGGLWVEYSDGRQEAVSSGEVSVRGMYGYA